MKAYLMTSGTIFALMAATHVVLTYQRWPSPHADRWLAPLVVAAITAGLALWAYRLLRRAVAA